MTCTSADDAERLLAVWAEDAAFMTQQPAFIATQPHCGIPGNAAFVNVVAWESAGVLRVVVSFPELRANAARYPDGAVSNPHLFEKVASPGSASCRCKSCWQSP